MIWNSKYASERNLQIRVDIEYIWNSICNLDITGFPEEIQQESTFDQVCLYSDILEFSAGYISIS